MLSSFGITFHRIQRKTSSMELTSTDRCIPLLEAKGVRGGGSSGEAEPGEEGRWGKVVYEADRKKNQKLNEMNQLDVFLPLSVSSLDIITE